MQLGKAISLNVKVNLATLQQKLCWRLYMLSLKIQTILSVFMFDRFHTQSYITTQLTN